MTWLYVLGGAWLYAVAGVATYRWRMGRVPTDGYYDDGFQWHVESCAAGIFWPVYVSGHVLVWGCAAAVLAPFRWWDRRVERRRVETERMARLLAEVESELKR